MNTAIWWLRRDLRLADNQALAAALEQAEGVLPLFILDPRLLASPYAGHKRQAFLFEGLRALDVDLRRRGSALTVCRGDPLAVLADLCAQTGAKGIFAEGDVSPYARSRDERVARHLPATFTPGITVHLPDAVRKSDGTPYTVFTPFSRRWRSLPFPGAPHPAPERLPAPPPVSGTELPLDPLFSAQESFPAGEAEAQRRLDAFTASAIERGAHERYTIERYAEARDRMDLDGTSALSPYLRLGMISARQAAWAARQAAARTQEPAARGSVEAWLNELIWREFYAAILYHFPAVRRAAFRPAMRRVPWRNAPADFAAWAEGRTGYPVVDAAMRQLNATGWMHNRARMIAASFLTKDLLVDWRLGERYFMQHLLDGDPACNNGGWQWTAGTGTDAAPYFRVFNPVLQGLKFDPQGRYVRRWLPVLENVPVAFVHAPWKMPAEMQRQAGCVIGEDYPAPVVEHRFARQRALDAYRQAAAVQPADSR
ncbi:MAG: cryptochrome/photolyase family protein [Chloroflexota bacterium]